TNVQGINANGAAMGGLGDLTVVRLVDDPATTVDESLGCGVEDFTAAGVVDGGRQIAIAERGACARVSKAIYGQMAGAAAVVMVNSTNDLPPYEGEIVVDPDTGEAYDVTIPFLGVRSSDGSVFVDASTARLTSQEVSNPGFRGYGSFTSSGPRSGDSAIGPDIAAPGVSTASAAVGTGTDGTRLSGTSMAAPHAAGVAALVRQAHPEWPASEVSAAIVSTADPDAVEGQDLVRGGVGLVDTAQAVATTVTATGDPFLSDRGWSRQATLSFGFRESISSMRGLKTVTVRNTGTSPVTFDVSTTPTEQSLEADLTLSRDSVTVQPGRTARVALRVSLAAEEVPTSMAGTDPFVFYEVSGNVVLTSPDATLRVPYVMVPRSNSEVTARADFSDVHDGANLIDGTAEVTLRNRRGALDTAARVFTWGLSDARRDAGGQPDTGYDLRAAGVQSYATGDDHLLVFAVNTYRRWSNAAEIEFDVVIDTDRDGTNDWAVFSYDSGRVRSGSSNGLAEVFLIDLHTNQISGSGFLAQAPTDSSTIVLPVHASDLGIEGAFDYTVQTGVPQGGGDSFREIATYDPTARAVSDGAVTVVPRGGSVIVDVDVDAAAYADQQPLGLMVVAVDNRSGASEARLIGLE
ncbi:S8 family serine peptidase, partial [Microbacterium sp.]|uniref:S8 family serine peptidase n=1 Tax=Microbacterium sp. TaxID=51671 RepID=UPI003A8439DB